MQHLEEKSQSKAAIEEACNALSWVHLSVEVASPTAHPFVKATLEGWQRTLARPVAKKDPVTVDMLEAIVADANRSGSLSDLRLATACLLGFSGFLRSGELLNLRPCDCSVLDDNMRIRITQSKTDQLQQGDEILIARSGSSTCPVTILERYMDRTGMSWEDQQFIFWSIQKTKKGEVLRKSGKISYS